MKTARTPHIEVVLPVYNEVKNILPLIKGLDGAISRLKGRATVSFLFINDGSSDGTSQLLYRLFKERTDLRVVDLVHNFGHGSALAAGLDHFEGDAAIFMDADLQDSPDSILPLVDAWMAGSKTVVAARGERAERAQALFKAFYWLLHKVSRNLPPIDFGTHCLLDKTVIARMRTLSERNRYFPGIVAYASGKIHAIPFDRGSRAHGDSRVGFMGLVNLAITALLSFSNAPIRLVSILGFIASGCGFLGGLYVTGMKLFTTRAIPGWASTMTLMAISSGIQLFCLGLIGEYLARVYDEVKARPLYLIERVWDKKAATKAKAEDAA